MQATSFIFHLDLGPESDPALGNCTGMDFVNRQRGLRLKPFESPTVLLATVELCNSYLAVLARGDSLAQYLGVNLFCNFLEEKFSALLSPNPAFSNQQGIEEQTKGFKWLSLIPQLDLSRLEDNGDGIYRCSIQGNIVEVSEIGYQMLKSGILQQFIEPWIIAGDIHKELEANEQTIAEASKWYGFALKAVENFESLLHGLSKRSDMLRDILRDISCVGPSNNAMRSDTQRPAARGAGKGPNDCNDMDNDLCGAGENNLHIPELVDHGSTERLQSKCSQTDQEPVTYSYTDPNIVKQACATSTSDCLTDWVNHVRRSTTRSRGRIHRKRRGRAKRI